jgi:hypothetical protein
MIKNIITISIVSILEFTCLLSYVGFAWFILVIFGN